MARPHGPPSPGAARATKGFRSRRVVLKTGERPGWFDGRADARENQVTYFTEVAGAYDERHADEGDEHRVARAYAAAIMASIGARSVLDVGSGTGGVVEFFGRNGARSIGIDPVKALVSEAVSRRAAYADGFILGDGAHLPFRDRSVDVVCASAVMHHVPEPRTLVAEMTRVARKMVYLSDNNRFGNGRPTWRLAKLLLWKAGLWPLAWFIATRGRGYGVSEGDGIFYSYSVYDSFGALSQWADRIFLVPTSGTTQSSWLHPLLTSNHAMLAAVKEDAEG